MTVDLRSDTITRPTPAMRDAIASAEVGDDAWHDDPTARALQERAAELLGKERALLFPSGIMANQTALHVLGERGAELVVEARAHIVHFEHGAAAAWSGLQLRPVEAPDGLLAPGLVEGALREPGGYDVDTGVVALENTHLASGGRTLSLDAARGIGRVARERGVPVHLDGARLWNACAASGREPAEYAAHADTVMVSLSKGLGCPVGSILAGDATTMERAWTVRRRMGGQMHQAGIVAAAGLHALDHHVERIGEDHAAARALAEGVDALDAFASAEPETNIVMIDVVGDGLDAGAVVEALARRDVLVGPFGPGRIRAVTHLDAPREMIDAAVEAFREVAADA